MSVAGPAVAGLVAILVALWALDGLRRPDVRARVPARQVATRAVVVFLVVGAILEILGGWFGSVGFFSYSQHPSLTSVMVALLPIVAAIAGAVAVSSVVGSLAFARLGPPRRPTTGSLAGPLALVGFTLVATIVFNFASATASTLASNAEQDALTNRSAAIRLTVSDLQASPAANGLAISAVSFRVTIRSDVNIDLAQNTKIANPRFVLTSTNGLSFEPTTSTTLMATQLPAGTEIPYGLVFDTTSAMLEHDGVRLASTSEGGALPGPWTLRVDIVDQVGQLYTVTTDLMVVANPAAPS